MAGMGKLRYPLCCVCVPGMRIRQDSFLYMGPTSCPTLYMRAKSAITYLAGLIKATLFPPSNDFCRMRRLWSWPFSFRIQSAPFLCFPSWHGLKRSFLPLYLLYEHPAISTLPFGVLYIRRLQLYMQFLIFSFLLFSFLYTTFFSI